MCVTEETVYNCIIDCGMWIKGSSLILWWSSGPLLVIDWLIVIEYLLQDILCIVYNFFVWFCQGHLDSRTSIQRVLLVTFSISLAYSLSQVTVYCFASFSCHLICNKLCVFSVLHKCYSGMNATYSILFCLQRRHIHLLEILLRNMIMYFFLWHKL